LLWWAIVGGWLLLAFTHLYRFSVPKMDSWCYFRAGCLCPHPETSLCPLLGDFQGADHIWGIHAGRAIALFHNSPILPADAVVYVGVICLLWLMVAWLSFRLVKP